MVVRRLLAGVVIQDPQVVGQGAVARGLRAGEEHFQERIEAVRGGQEAGFLVDLGEDDVRRDLEIRRLEVLDALLRRLLLGVLDDPLEELLTPAQRSGEKPMNQASE
jgi:hypothetical protein